MPLTDADVGLAPMSDADVGLLSDEDVGLTPEKPFGWRAAELFNRYVPNPAQALPELAEQIGAKVFNFFTPPRNKEFVINTRGDVDELYMRPVQIRPGESLYQPQLTELNPEPNMAQSLGMGLSTPGAILSLGLGPLAKAAQAGPQLMRAATAVPKVMFGLPAAQSISETPAVLADPTVPAETKRALVESLPITLSMAAAPFVGAQGPTLPIREPFKGTVIDRISLTPPDITAETPTFTRAAGPREIQTAAAVEALEGTGVREQLANAKFGQWMGQGNLDRLLQGIQEEPSAKRRARIASRIEQAEKLQGQTEEQVQSLAQTVDRLEALKAQERAYGRGELPDVERAGRIPIVGEQAPTPIPRPLPEPEVISPPVIVPANQPSIGERQAAGLVGHGGAMLPQEQAGGRISFAGEAGGLPLGGGLRSSGTRVLPEAETTFGPEFERFKGWVDRTNDRLVLEENLAEWQKVTPKSERSELAEKLLRDRLQTLAKEPERPVQPPPRGWGEVTPPAAGPVQYQSPTSLIPRQRIPAREVLANISQDLNSAYNGIAAKLLEIGDKEGLDVPLEVGQMTAPLNIGEYAPPAAVGGERIIIARGAVTDTETVIHEIVHAMSSVKLARELRGSFSTASRAGLNDYLMNGQNVAVKDLVRLYLDTFDRFNALQRQQYGMSNLKEFVSEAWADRTFQQALAKIKDATTNRTYWDRFKDAIKRLLGLDVTDTQLASIIDASGRLMEQKRPPEVSPDITKGGELNAERLREDERQIRAANVVQGRTGEGGENLERKTPGQPGGTETQGEVTALEKWTRGEETPLTPAQIAEAIVTGKVEPVDSLSQGEVYDRVRDIQRAYKGDPQKFLRAVELKLKLDRETITDAEVSEMFGPSFDQKMRVAAGYVADLAKTGRAEAVATKIKWRKAIKQPSGEEASRKVGEQHAEKEAQGQEVPVAGAVISKKYVPAVREWGTGKVYTGTSHIEIRETQHPAYESSNGFVDENGNFLTLTEIARREAGVTGRSGQGAQPERVGKETTIPTPGPSPETLAEFKQRERGLRGETFALSAPRMLMTPKESGFTQVDKPVDATQLWNRLANKLPSEARVLEDLGIGKAVRGKGKVTPEEAAKMIQEMGPRIEVKKFTGELPPPGTPGNLLVFNQAERAEYHNLQHEFETTLSPDFRYDINRFATSADMRIPPAWLEEWKRQPSYTEHREAAINRYLELSRKRAAAETQTRPVGHDVETYRQLSPKDQPTEVWMVRVPVKLKPEEEARIQRLHRPGFFETEGEVYRAQEREKEKQVLFKGGHFGSEDVNLLGWARVQRETVNGRKVASIVEVQSDWFAIDTKTNPGKFTTEFDGKVFDTRQQAEEHLRKSHPLADSWQRVVLKMTLEQARREGYEGVVLNDAATVMMSEGQDAVAKLIEKVDFRAADREASGAGENPYSPRWWGPDYEKGKYVRVQNIIYRVDKPEANPARRVELAKELQPYGEGGESYIPQEKGMRFNYDTLLPRVMEELTGTKGERVDLGEHQRAFEKPQHPDLLPNVRVGRVNPDWATATPEQLKRDKIDPNTIGKYFVWGDRPEFKNRFFDTREEAEAAARSVTSIPRKDLILREPTGELKTHATGLFYPLEKTKPPFSLFEKDKPGSRPTYLYSVPGMFFDPEFYKKSWDQVKGLGGLSLSKVLDKMYSGDVERSTKEGLRHLEAKWSGWAFPHHVAANENVANLLVEYAAANDAAPVIARARVTEVLGKHWKDKEFDKKLGLVVVEDRLRALEQQHRTKGQTALADQVTHVMTSGEFSNALRDPEIRAALERHKQIIQTEAERRHVALGGKLAPAGPETGAFANLLTISTAKNFEEAKKWIYGKGNVQAQAILRGSVFEKKAYGTAPGYITSYRQIGERMITGNYKRDALLRWITAAVEAKVYKFMDASGDNTVYGKPGTIVPVSIKLTPWGKDVIKSVIIRNDLLEEAQQAMKSGGRAGKAGGLMLLDLMTEAQVIGPTDFVYHTGNMYASIVGSPGGKNFIHDLARIVPYYKQLDTLTTIAWDLYRTIMDTPEVQKQLADIAQIGALRPGSPEYSSTLLAKMTGGLLDTGKWIRIFDRAGRLRRNQMFDYLVKQGADDTPLNRREFVNKMGQYNSKMMSPRQEWMRNMFSQFVVAGRTFNRNAIQRVLGINEVSTSSKSLYWKLKFLSLARIVATVSAIPITFNILTTGRPFGRPGTPIGKIDTGKDDEKGRHITIDPGQLDLTRRGLRITGGQALLKGIREGEPAGEIIKNMLVDIIRGQAHPWMGPPTRVALEGVTEFAKTKDLGESVIAAAKQVNPLAPGILERFGVEPDLYQRTFKEQMGGVIGVGKSRMPKHEERLQDVGQKQGLDLSDLGQRAEAERALKETSPERTRKEQAEGGKIAIDRQRQRSERLIKSLAKEDRGFLQANGIEPPYWQDTITRNKTTVTLSKAEQERFQAIVKEEYEAVIAELRNDPGFVRLAPEEKKVEANKQFIRASREARKRIADEIEEGRFK